MWPGWPLHTMYDAKMRTRLCLPQGHCGSSRRLGLYSRASPTSAPAGRGSADAVSPGSGQPAPANLSLGQKAPGTGAHHHETRWVTLLGSRRGSGHGSCPRGLGGRKDVLTRRPPAPGAICGHEFSPPPAQAERWCLLHHESLVSREAAPCPTPHAQPPGLRPAGLNVTHWSACHIVSLAQPGWPPALHLLRARGVT